MHAEGKGYNGSDCVDLPRLGAVFYASTEGPKADQLLAQVSRLLRLRGVRLAGVVQVNGQDGNRCDMELEDLASGLRVRISEERGAGSRGCRLDSFALEKLVGVVSASLGEGTEVVLINKFGKREAEGGGFRQLIGAALSSGARVLVGVSNANLVAWEGFACGLCDQIPMDEASLIEWCLGR